jgi:2-C-methyl-D-erythritol 4-phosphate cytidylyltransferase
MVLAILGGRYAGASPLIHLPTLARQLERLPAQITTCVFVDDPVPDAVDVATIEQMIGVFEASDLDALARFAGATEAVKRVDQGTVVEGIERSELVTVRSPEVISRAALEAAVEDGAPRLWINASELVSRAGFTIGFYGSQLATKAEAETA